MRARWEAPTLVSLQSGFEAAAPKVMNFPEGPGDSCDPGDGCPGPSEEVGPS
jgi:hypothetical protein